MGLIIAAALSLGLATPANAANPKDGISASFDPATGVLTVSGNDLNNTITISRDAAGTILVNGRAVASKGRASTVANTGLIQVFGRGGNDTLALDEANGVLPKANMSGGAGNDTLTGGSGADQLSGDADNDTLLGKGGQDTIAGGAGDDTITGGDGDDIAVSGGDGNDTFVWNPGDDSDVLEGDAGADRLKVNGGNGAEIFTIAPNGTRVRVDRLNPAPFFQDLGSVEAVELAGNGGDDIVTGSLGLAALVQLTVDGGTGNDTITGSDGNDTLLGGDGNDLITPSRGNDVVLLGAGDDVVVWNPGDGSDTIEGQGDQDTLRFNGSGASEKFELSANGPRLRLTRDVANVVMDTDGIETVDLAALGGADIVTIGDLLGTTVSDVNIDLAAVGGVGDAVSDQVIVKGTAGDDAITVAGSGGSASVTGLAARVDVAHAEPTDSLVIDTLAGNDNVNQSGLVPGTIQLTVN